MPMYCIFGYLFVSFFAQSFFTRSGFRSVVFTAMRGVVDFKAGDFVTLYDKVKKRSIGKHRCIRSHFYRDRRLVWVKDVTEDEAPDLTGAIDFAKTSEDCLLPLRQQIMDYLVATWTEDDEEPDALREEAVAAVVTMDTKILYYTTTFLQRVQNGQPVQLRYSTQLLHDVLDNTLGMLEKLRGVNMPLQSI